MLLLSLPLRTTLALWFSLILVGCGEQKINYNSNEHSSPTQLFIDPELQPYFDSYLTDAAAAGVGISEQKLQDFKGLMWTDQVNIQSAEDATVLGVCQRRPGLRYVELLRPNTEGKAGATLVDAITLKVMVYHELGHCLHDFSGHTSGKGAAIMNSYLQPARYFDLEALLRDHFQMLKTMQDNPSFRP